MVENVLPYLFLSYTILLSIKVGKEYMTKMTEIKINGMYCANCSNRIEKVIGGMDGVTDVVVNLATEKGKVTYNSHQISIRKIIEKINQIGFHAKVEEKSDNIDISRVNEIKGIQRKFIFSILLTIPLAWAMLAHFSWASFIHVPPILSNPYIQFLVALPIQFIIGYTFYERAWQAIKTGNTNMDVLVVISTSAAFFYSHYLTFSTPLSLYQTEQIVLYYETSAFIITFILLGRLLEAKTKWKTTEALEKLYDIKQKQATLYENDEETLISVEQLHPGQIIIVKPGEKVPIDGQVIDGHSFVNESLLTGESQSLEKREGSTVYAGTLNENGLLKVLVTKTDSETTLSKVINIVEDAQTSKAPIQQFANKIASVFVPVVLTIALGTFIMSYFYFELANFNRALVKVIAVLIVACPCAIGLAAPTSMMVGSGRAAQLGILFREGKFLELLGKCNTICLDKTGTITSGIPTVTHFSLSNKFKNGQVIDFILAIEQQSNHPIAKAVVHKFGENRKRLPKVNDVTNMPGKGIKAIIQNHTVIIASPSYFYKSNLFIPESFKETIHSLENNGNSISVIMIDNEFAALIGLSDEVKLSSVQAIKQLKDMGLNIALLTGDHKKAALNVANKISIKDIYFQCTPVGKSNIIKDFMKKGHTVAMVGDGVNDAPALAVSDVGIAIGTGSDIAIESGDITIINNDLNRLVNAIKISRKTMLNIKQNFVWAFIYNIIMIPIAMFGILLPWLAAAAMAFSSIAVVLNSLRLKRVTLD